MTMGAILVLRRPEDSAEIMDKIQSYGYDVMAEAVLSITYLEADYSIARGDCTLVFTSAHGVEAFAKACPFRGNKVFAVGPNTAEAALAAGFEAIETGAGTVEALAPMLKEAEEKGLTNIVYIRAEDISTDLKSILGKQGQKLDEILAYRAIPAHNLSIRLLHALDKAEIKAVCVFSARGGQVFSDLMEQYGRTVRLKTVTALCLSEHVVKSLSVLPFKRCVVSETPDRYGMIKLLETFHN